MDIPDAPISQFAYFFKDGHLKVKRANKHIADLKGTIFALKESSTVRVQKNNHTGANELIHTLEFAKYADDIALIVGDAIHNLRSALDFAWVSMLQNNVPTADLDRAKFPVYPTPEDLKGALNGIDINAGSDTGYLQLARCRYTAVRNWEVRRNCLRPSQTRHHGQAFGSSRFAAKSRN